MHVNTFCRSVGFFLFLGDIFQVFFFQCLDVTDGNDDVSHGRDDEGWKRRLAEHQFLETGSFLSTRELKEIVSQSLIRLKRFFF